MKKRIAEFLLRIAKRLCPELVTKDIQIVEGYEARKLGLAYAFTKKDIKEYRFKDGKMMSLRDGYRFIVSEARKKIRTSIIARIDMDRLIEYHVESLENGGIKVTGELKVYIPSK